MCGKHKSKHVILKKVIEKLKRHGLTTSKKKCQFHSNSVTYLGNAISGNDREPKPDLVEAIHGAPEPDNKDKLLSLLGLGEYFSKFVQQFSMKVVPLCQLLKKDVRFDWDEVCKYSLNKIKHAISTRLALCPFDSEKHML
nr:uncharacterized mitochondrial protein AtMg00860-like [Chrysemys picta bellii]